MMFRLITRCLLNRNLITNRIGSNNPTIRSFSTGRNQNNNNTTIETGYPNSSNRVCAVLGSQWGDEGKGKLVDILAKYYDIIARFNGGSNAGKLSSIQYQHTLFTIIAQNH